MKGNVINLNTLHLNSVRLNGIGKVQSVSLKGGSTEDPVFPPVEPPIEPEPTPTYTLSASVTNGMVSATRNGSAVNLPFTANEGDVIVVEVTPNDGYEFNGWNDGNTDNPRSITMTSDVALSAQCVEVVQPPVGKYIQFEDKAVEAICVENWSSDGIGLTEEDAAKVTSIGTKFKGNTEITSFDEFRYFTGVTFLGTDTSSYNGGAFYGCTNLRSITLPKSVKAIRNGSFMDCTSLRTIGGLENVEEIRNRAFYGCSQWNEDVEFPSLTSLASTTFTNSGIKGFSAAKLSSIAGSDNYNMGAFTNCDSLTKVSIPMVADVGRVAFSLCDNLEEIELPSATAIGVQAFYRCSKLKKIICRTTTPPTLVAVSAFSSTNSALVIYVPDASLEAYKTATNWNQFADRIHPLSEIEGSLVFYDKLVGDGTAYINTELMPNSFDNYEWDVDAPSVYNRFVFGSKSSALFMGALLSNKNQTYYLYQSATTSAISVTGDNGERMHRALRIIAKGDGTYRREEYRFATEKARVLVESEATTDKNGSRPLLVLACQKSATDATIDRINKGAIRSFIVADSRTNEVRMSLKPCTWNGEAGMWDEVGGKFYGNAATSGEFSVAND